MDKPTISAPEDPDHQGHELPYAAELQRKALHLVALVVPLFVAWAGKALALAVLLPLGLLAFAGDVLRVRVAGFKRLVHQVFGFMMRPEEIPPLGGPVRVNGATWVLLSAALVVLVFPVRLAVPAFVMFMIGDAAAAVVGRRFGRHHWGQNPRTVEGSLSFLAVSLLTLLFFPGVTFWVGAVGAVAACAAEALPRPLNDNIRVPFVAALVMFLLERFVQGRMVTLFFGG